MVSHRRVRCELWRQRRNEPEDVLLSPAVMASCGLANVGYKDKEDDNNMLPRMATAIRLYIHLISRTHPFDHLAALQRHLKHVGSRRWRFNRHACFPFILI